MRICSKKVDYLLAEQGLTKTALAVRCGVSRQCLGAILRRGRCEPRTAGKLAAGLGVPVRDIVGGDCHE